MTDALFCGNNLDIPRHHIADEPVDLISPEPPFNSSGINVPFRKKNGTSSPAQIQAFTGTFECGAAQLRFPAPAGRAVRPE